MIKTYLHGQMNMNNDEMRSGKMCVVRINGPKVSEGLNGLFRGSKFCEVCEDQSENAKCVQMIQNRFEQVQTLVR